MDPTPAELAAASATLTLAVLPSDGEVLSQQLRGSWSPAAAEEAAEACHAAAALTGGAVREAVLAAARSAARAG